MKTTFDVLLNVVWNTILFQINTIFEEFITPQKLLRLINIENDTNKTHK
jgi:hypothetical protein